MCRWSGSATPNSTPSTATIRSATITSSRRIIPQFSTSSCRVRGAARTAATYSLSHATGGSLARRTYQPPHPGASNRRWYWLRPAKATVGWALAHRFLLCVMRRAVGQGPPYMQTKGLGRGPLYAAGRVGLGPPLFAFVPKRSGGPRPTLHNAQLERLQNGPGPVAHAELGQDVGHVILYGPLGDAERIGDFLVAVAAGHEAQYLGFAFGQRVRAVQAREVV